jgi:hypothetical protein
MRAQDEFPSPPFVDYLQGYGLVLLLAAGGAVWMIRAARRAGEPLGQRLLPVVWAVVGLGLPYLPLAFQRKLVMGLHLPLAFLAAIAAVALARQIARAVAGDEGVAETRRGVGTAAPAGPRHRLAWSAALLALLLVTVPTNWLWVRWAVEDAVQPRTNLNALPTFLSHADLETMRWARENLPADGLIFCCTASGRLFAALAGRPVYVGHFSETPDSPRRVMEAIRFFEDAESTPEERRAFLAARNIRYVYQGSTERLISGFDLARDPLVRKIYSNDGAALYELPPTTLASDVPAK